MPNRDPLLSKLSTYKQHTQDKTQHSLIEEIEHFIQNNVQCFERSLLQGHVTGSAWLVNKDRTKACMTLHRKFKTWVQLGGHADGNPDILAVALTEAREESGILGIEPISTEIFDVDIHTVAQFNDIPEHKHYDIRFLLQVQADERLVISDESIDLAWFSHNDPLLDACNISVQSLVKKWRTFLGY